MCNATMLVKYRLIKLSTSSLDHNDPPMIFNESQMWNAIRAVQHRYSNSIPPSDPISSDSPPDNLDAIPSKRKRTTKKKKGTEESSSTTPIGKKTRKKILKNKKGSDTAKASSASKAPQADPPSDPEDNNLSDHQDHGSTKPSGIAEFA